MRNNISNIVSSRRRAALTAVGTGLLATAPVPGEVLFDTREQLTPSLIGAGQSISHAASAFKTGTGITTVQSVTLLLANPDSLPHYFTIRILEDRDGLPGPVAGYFDTFAEVPASTTSPVPVTATDSGIILRPDTVYWLDVSSNEDAVDAGFRFPQATEDAPALAYAPVSSPPPAGGFRLSQDAGATYPVYTGPFSLAYQFEGGLGAVVPSYARLIESHRPAAHYRFEETSDTLTVNDSSPAQLHSLSLNNATLEEPGISGNAAGFGGTASWINLPHILDPGAGSDFSVEIWAKSPTFTSGVTDQIIVAQKDLNGTGRSLIFHDSDGSDQFANFFNGGARIGGSRVKVSDNEWHHVVLVYESSDNSLRWYIDGFDQGDGTPSLAAAPESSAGGWVLGGHKNNNQQFFNGLLDEVAVYPYRLDDPNDDGDFQDSRVLEHYRALVPEQPFGITGIRKAAGEERLEVQWHSAYGDVYNVYSSPNLSDWNLEQTAVEPTGASTGWSYPITTTDPVFFRVERIGPGTGGGS